MKVFVTGGAGFVGSNLVERLLDEGHNVTVFDNLSAGSLEFLRNCQGRAGFRFIQEDLLHLEEVERAVQGHDVLFHLSANSDIERGRLRPDTDFIQGTEATFNVLEAMRRAGVRQLVFSSSSVVYGEPSQIPTPEDYGPLFPISLYGASKLACEVLISAYGHNYGIQAWVCRFANICGRHGTHGAIVDFIRKLQVNPRRLEVLGDGNQAKPNLHVSECVDGIIFAWQHAKEPLNYFNLGCEGATTAREIAEVVIETLRLKEVKVEYGGGKRGWPGDVAQVRLDCSKMEKLGWKARLTSAQAVWQAAQELTEELLCRQSF